jgi:hypothetical protein
MPWSVDHSPITHRVCSIRISSAMLVVRDRNQISGIDSSARPAHSHRGCPLSCPHSPTERAALQTADIARRLMRSEPHQEVETT